MKLLAIDTATAVTRVAVLDDADVLVEVEDAEHPHGAALLPAVDRALTAAGSSLDAIDGFAVSIGPGSFTGVRIGLSTVKAFALGTRRRVAAVPTLAALAWPFREQARDLVACLDAQRGEFYAAGYRVTAAGLLPQWPEAVLVPEAVVARSPDSAWLIGEGVEGLSGVPASVSVRAAGPTAAAVGALGIRILGRGEGLDAATLAPRYVRRAEAEARRLGSPVETPDPAGGLL